jgi:hypothetical protein
MSLPSNYKPTSQKIAPYYRPFFSASIDNNGKISVNSIENVLKFGQDNGATYTYPLIELPMRWFRGDPQFADLIEGSRDTALRLEMAKALDPGKRATQPFAWNNDSMYFFLDDQLGSTLQVEPRGLYLKNWGITLASGLLPNPWAVGSGVSAYHNIWSQIVKAAQNRGVTMDYILFDMEGYQFNSYLISQSGDARMARAVVDSEYYSQPWQGISSWQYYFENAGGLTTFGINNKNWFNIGATNYYAWDNAASRYIARIFDICNYDYLKTSWPDVEVSNYGSARSDGFTGIDNTYFDYFGEKIGNASSGIFYTTAGGIDVENNATYVISEKNPSSALVWGGSATGTRNKKILGGPRFSFMKSIQDFRSQKRNAYNYSLHPWIGAVNMWTEGYEGTIWQIGNSRQSDVNVIKNSWNKENIISVTKGITAPDGSTNAFAVRTITTTGSTFNYSLDYFLHGTTPGATYVFSYYINLNEGYTGSLFKLQNWKKYYSYDTDEQGLTYYQTLPVGTGPFYREGPISFNAGDSGWTKVEFKFTGTTNPYLAISNQCQNWENVSASGYTSYIWNPELLIENSSGNTFLVGITAYDAKRYEVSTIYPTIGFADAVKGYNPKYDAFFSRRGGNSGYYYEMIRHFCLMGAKAFGFFNGNMFIDYSLGNINAIPGQGWNTFGSLARTAYGQAGGTLHTQLIRQFNDTIEDVNSKLGGFTLTTAKVEWENWLTDYVVNGAPSTNSDWWWRITALPGATVYCNGETLSAYGKIGTWVSTTGPSIDSLSITSSKWPLPPEPSLVTPPLKDFNMVGLTGTQSLINMGFTYSRGTTATYINENGKVVVVGPNQARFAYDPNTLEAKGLMLEAPCTNLLNWSESFALTGGSNNNWEDSGILRNEGFTSPSDSNNAIKFTAVNSHATVMTTAPTGVSGYKSFSFWIKGVTGNESAFYTIDGGTSWQYISDLGNSWKRKEIEPFLSDHNVGFKIGNTGESVFIWGAQLERRLDSIFDNYFDSGPAGWSQYYNISTSYVKSDSSRGYRGADICELLGGDLTSWFGITQGTLLYEVYGLNTQIMQFSENNNQWQALYLQPVPNRCWFGAFDNVNSPFVQHRNLIYSSFFIFYPYYTLSRDTLYKFGMSYEPKKVVLTGNLGVNSSISESFISLPPRINKFNFAVASTGAVALTKNYPLDTTFVKRLRYWDFVIPEKLLYLMSIGGTELVGVDNSVEWTWEQYNGVLNEYGFNEYYGSYLT